MALMVDDESLKVLVKGTWVMRDSECGTDQYSVVQDQILGEICIVKGKGKEWKGRKKIKE